MIDKAKAESQIKSEFKKYKKLTDKDDAIVAKLMGGKLYEIFVLSKLIENLVARGFQITFHGSDLKFKAAPGYVKQTDCHFDVKLHGIKRFQIFVNIECMTLGSQKAAYHDLSCYHELDLAVITPGVSGRPRHDQVALAVECKDVATLTKSIVRSVLGLRRELSFWANDRPSILAHILPGDHIRVPANPPSELWLVHSDLRGNNYAISPKFFGVELFHWTP